MSRPIYQLVDELSQRGMTVRMLQTLDWVMPDKYVNLVGFEESIRVITGESDNAFIQKVGERAIHLYNDTTQGYQRALWIYQTVDSVQGLAGTASMASKIGESFGLSWISNLTPKADTIQAVDLGLKLVGEVIAFCTLNGVPGDHVSEFVESLTDYRHEARMRLAALICIDGILPLGSDFVQKATAMLGKAGTQGLAENERYQRLKSLIPGSGTQEQLQFVQKSVTSLHGFVSQFVLEHNITQTRIFQSIEKLSEKLDGKLDYAAAFLDMTTDYFEHTGIQSIARSLITRAMSEI